MKRSASITLKSICLLLVILLIFLIKPQTIFADTSGDYKYTVVGDNATIKEYLGSGGDVIIPSSLGGYSVTSIGANAFFRCSNLTGVSIPNGVTSIGDQAFIECTRLTSVTIPNSVTRIGYNAFYNCTSLREINIPDSITSIGNSAFYNCSSLTYLTIPDRITTINLNTFAYCSGLKSINIPKSVERIYDNAFFNCTQLTSAKFLGNAPDVGNAVFDNCASSFKVFYYEESTGFTSPWYGYSIEQIPVYSIKYDGNGNTEGSAPVDSKTYLSGDAVTAAGNTGSLAKTGFTFSGWNTKADGTGVNYNEGETFSMRTSDVTLYAKWDIITGLTVAISNTNGSVDGLCPSYTYGDVVTLTAIPNINYKFVSWTDGAGNVLSTNATYSFEITQKIKLNASFEAIPLFTVTFFDQDKQILSTQTLAQGEDAAAPPDPVKPNCTFVGWDTPITNVQSNLNIYPVFKELPKTFNVKVNNGTGSGTYDASDYVTVSAATDGELFAYWIDEAGTIVSDNQTYTFKITRDITLTAVLIDIPPVELPQVILDDNVTYKTTNPNYVKMYFIGTFIVPSGYQMIECGFVSLKNADENPCSSLTLQTPGAFIVKASNMNKAGQIEGTIKTTYGSKFYVRGYLICRNMVAEEILTIYSTDVVLGVKPSNAKGKH